MVRDRLHGQALGRNRRRASHHLRQPFFLSVAFLAPHTGAPREPGDPGGIGTPAVAPRHRGRFALAQLPLGGSFNEDDVSDKPPGARRPRLGARDVADIEALYRQRLESLVAVDEAVETIVGALDAAGELDRTLIMFTSDNGYLAGEHRMGHGKAQVYEPAIRVPLLMRGPGVPGLVRRGQLVTNADLAPTILDAALGDARARAGWPFPVAAGPEPGRWPRPRRCSIEIGRGTGLATTAVRTRRWLYAERAGGARELYDLRADPDELSNLSASRATHTSADGAGPHARGAGALQRLDMSPTALTQRALGPGPSTASRDPIGGGS